jgi:hypothetical protein
MKPSGSPIWTLLWVHWLKPPSILGHDPIHSSDLDVRMNIAIEIQFWHINILYP